MGEVPDPERHPLDALHEVVDRFGRPVRYPGLVPGGDLAGPPHNRATELAHLGWAQVVREVDTELVDELDRERRVVDAVNGSDDLLGVPRPAHLAARGAGFEQAKQLPTTWLLEASVGVGL